MALLDKRSLAVGAVFGSTAAVVLTTCIQRRRQREDRVKRVPDWSCRVPTFLDKTAAAVWKHGPLPSAEAIRFLQPNGPSLESWLQEPEPVPHSRRSPLGLDAISQGLLETKPWPSYAQAPPAVRAHPEWHDDLAPRVPSLFKPEWVREDNFTAVWTTWPGVEKLDGVGVVLYMHGGGNILGTAEASIPHSLFLSKYLGQQVLSVDYRRSPENPLPASTDDVVAAYLWLLQKKGIAPSKIGLIGFSSGGASVVLALQKIIQTPGIPSPACGVPVSPWHFYDERQESGQVQMWQMVAGNFDAYGNPTGAKNDIHDATFSFLSGPLKGLPPLYVVCGSLEHKFELIAAQDLVRKVNAAGGQAKLDLAPYQTHCPAERLAIPEHALCAGRIAAFFDSAFAAEPL